MSDLGRRFNSAFSDHVGMPLAKQHFFNLMRTASFFCLCLLAVPSESAVSGSLFVSGRAGGRYEIYKIASDNPLQLTAESSGDFNREVTLPTGTYLVMADCSSEIVHIYPGQKLRKVAHSVIFLPTKAPESKDGFVVRCTRGNTADFRQTLENQFALNVLGGTRELLVGMRSVKLDLPPHSESIESRSFILSSIQVGEHLSRRSTEYSSHDRYYVSPVDSLAPHTESQLMGSKEFLLGGDYWVELNGSRAHLKLNPGENAHIIPASLKVASPREADLDRAEKILGEPPHFELAGGHFLHLNEVYALLPGEIALRLNGSRLWEKISLEVGEQKVIEARALLIESGCRDWNCFDARKVRLYPKTDQAYIAEGLVDVPFFFFVSQAGEFSFGLEGARDLKFLIPPQKKFHTARLGFLEVNPEPNHKPGIISDLLRVEPRFSAARGATLDLSLDRPSKIPLIEGSYSLAHYTTYQQIDGARKKNAVNFEVRAGETKRLSLPTFLSEKKYATYLGRTP